MKFLSCKLYKIERAYDETMHAVDRKVYLRDIEVSLNVKSVNTYENGVIYRVNDIVGLTPFKGLDVSHDYLIETDNSTYKVVDIVMGRMCVLSLELVY